MKICIVIPIIDCLDYTKAALKSLQSETHKLDVLIIDNGSGEDVTSYFTYATIPQQTFAQYLGLHESVIGVTYLKNGENVGLTRAWNQGAKHAKENGCQYTLFLNNDVLLHPKTIDNLVAELEKNPEWGMATGINERGWCDANGGPTSIFTKEIPSEGSSQEHPDFSCFMLRMTAYETIGEFDEEFSRRGKAFFEDNDYHRRMKLAGIPAQCTTLAPYYHYGSVTAAHAGVIAEPNRQYYIQKWGGVPEQETLETPFGL